MTATIAEPLFVSVPTAARVLDVTRSEIEASIDQGAIATKRLKGRTLVAVESLLPEDNETPTLWWRHAVEHSHFLVWIIVTRTRATISVRTSISRRFCLPETDAHEDTLTVIADDLHRRSLAVALIARSVDLAIARAPDMTPETAAHVHADIRASYHR